MSSNVEQRRGKKSSQTVPQTSSNEPLTPQEKLRVAEIKVLSSKQKSDELYAQWREQLVRISYLVVIVAIHQAIAPTTDCIKDIKAVNEVMGENTIDWTQALVLILKESMCEIVGILLTASIAVFLAKSQPGDLTGMPYMISCALIPLQLGLYFQTKRIGCLGDVELLDYDLGDRKRTFPLGSIFHVIVTLTYWFMKYGNDKANENIRYIENLKRQLNAAKAASKKKAEK